MAASGLRADHVVIPVFDAEAAYAFYGDVLGLPLVDAIDGDDWGGYPWLMMLFGLDDGRQLVLVALRGAARPPESDLPPDSRHYAFSVEDEGALESWRERLAERGVETWDEDHGEQRSIYFADPDGTVLEITAPPTPSVTAESTSSDDDAANVVRRWLAASR